MARTQTKEQTPDLLQGVEQQSAKKNAVAKAKPTGTSIATVEVQAPPTNLLAVIARAASLPNIDVSKMKELLAMQREIEGSQDAAAFNRALLAARQAMPLIVRDRENPHTRSKYPALENVSQNIDKICASHGFASSFGTADSPLPQHYRIVCDLSHSYGTPDYPRGSTRRYHIDLESDTAGAKGTSNKTAVQGVGSTMSYGRRYLKVMIWDLTIVGEDNDGARKARAASNTAAETPSQKDEGPKTINGSQAKQLIKAIDECGVEIGVFMEKYKINAAHELLTSQFDEAIQNCRDYGARRKASPKQETSK